jgi:nucleotide-binding universal stress UspA family protein
MSTARDPARTALDPESVFARVLVGVDGSEPGFEAVRQAARLVAPDGRLELFGAVFLAETNLAGASAPKMREEVTEEAQAALRRAEQIVGSGAKSRLVDGAPKDAILDELERTDASLVAVGTHGHSRLSEILLGGVAGELLHNAPCSVCIARPPKTDTEFPRTIVAGYDGSPESEAAAGVARHVAERFGVPLTVVVALGGKDVDVERAHRFGAVAVDAHPIDALVEAAADADLLVVGSRGLHGLKSLGSVSERVAHNASSSVLVVRAPTA